MSTQAGTDTYQKQVASLTNPAAKPAALNVAGELVRFWGKYTVTGSETTGDKIPVIKLPIGAILLPESVRYSTDGAAGTSTAISTLGDAGSASRYSSTSVTITGAVTKTAVTPTNAIAITPFAIDTDANSVVLATITHAGAPTAGKFIVFEGSYYLP